MSLESKIAAVVSETVAKPTVAADPSAAPAITQAVMEEVQPRIEYLTNTEPWWQSRTTLGAIIIIASRLLAHFGHEIPQELHGAILDLIIAFGPYFGAGLALWGRWISKKPLGH